MRGLRFGWWIVILGAVVMGAFLSKPPSVVNWSALRGVALESDDWGFPGFAPSIAAWEGIDKEQLAPGRFPAVYWNTSLEDSAEVQLLCQILKGARGRDGLGAVFQPNYVMGSLEFLDSPAGGSWREFAFPAVPAAYERPGMFAQVQQGIGQGVWYPELHARYHYDPHLRKERSQSSAAAQLAVRRGIVLFPDSEGARELGSWRDVGELRREFAESLAIFRRAFGRYPESVIAPDYTWNRRMEEIWKGEGVSIVQAKREQRNPDWGPGLPGRALKFLERRWAQLTNPECTYLERNVRLEPVQHGDPKALLADCVADVHQAWSRGEPAIIETHRVNFTHLDPQVEELGRSTFAQLLAELTGETSNAPVFLVDSEIAQLRRFGVSAVRRGEQLVLRNGTRSRKVVGFQEPTDGKTRYFLVPKMTTLVLNNSGQIHSFSM